MESFPTSFRAPEILSELWFNSDPLSISSLRGTIVLVDFWDYSCHACLAGLPYLGEWNRRYAELGLVTVGVHCPEFPFGRDQRNVSREIEKLGIKYPVVVDNDFVVWNSYRVRVWPTRFLIDKNGFIRYRQEGMGSYQNFEHAIQSLLMETGHRGELPLIVEPLRDVDVPGAICYRVTPEIMMGYQRGTVGNVEGYFPESVVEYRDPGFYLEGRIYLHGKWVIERDFLRLHEKEGDEGYVALSYQAREVNAVLKPEGEVGFQMFVSQDGSFLTKENRGEDVRIDAEGRSFVLISEPRLYNLVKNPEFGEHTLKLSSRSSGFALYSISFVSCIIPELVSTN
jgi:thiol-disulfide isomerase/thioredoxin